LTGCKQTVIKKRQKAEQREQSKRRQLTGREGQLLSTHTYKQARSKVLLTTIFGNMAESLYIWGRKKKVRLSGYPEA